MLEYLTRTRAINIHSKIMDHDASSFVGIFDSAGLSRRKLLGVFVVKEEPVIILELVQDVELGNFCVVRMIYTNTVSKILQRMSVVPEK